MTAIKKELEIAAPQDTVWRHLVDHDLLAAWLMRNDFKPEVGRRFHLYQHPAGEWDGTIECKVIEVDPPNRLSFTWDANTIGKDTLVTIDLVPSGEGTKLTLVHTNWEGVKGDLSAHVKSHSDGWENHLDVLAKSFSQTDTRSPAPAIDWTQFKLYVAIDAAPDLVAKSWVTQSGMESFFVEMMQISSPEGELREFDDEARPGDHFVWRWDSGNCVQGSYLDVMPGREAAFTFGDSNVRVRAYPHGAGTLLELCQYDIPDTPEAHMNIHANCRAAFSTYFDPSTLGISEFPWND